MANGKIALGHYKRPNPNGSFFVGWLSPQIFIGFNFQYSVKEMKGSAAPFGLLQTLLRSDIAHSGVGWGASRCASGGVTQVACLLSIRCS